MSSFNFDYRSTRLMVTGALLALAGAALGVGCGGGGLDYPTQFDFCQGVAQADCSGPIVTACYGSSSDQDTQACINVRSSAEQCNPHQYVVYHPEFADQCIAAHQSLYGSNPLDPTLYQAMEQACLPTLNNGGEAGVSCTQQADCDVGAGLSCIIHEAAEGQPTRGTCQVPVPVMPGTSCNGAADQCVDQNGNTNTFYCALGASGSGHNCIQNVSGICGSDVSCTSGSYCNAATGHCAAQLADTFPCTADAECAGGFCVPTSATGGECATMLTLGFASPACAAFESSKH